MVNGYGLKSWDKLSAEMTIEHGENPKDGYKAMDDLIEEVHRKSYQTLSFVADNVPVPELQIGKEQRSMIEEMEVCTTFDEINSFRFTVKNEEEKAVYEKKLTELSPKKIK